MTISAGMPMRASAACSKRSMSKASPVAGLRCRSRSMSAEATYSSVVWPWFEGARGDQPAQQILRDRLASAIVTGETAQDFRPLQPMLEQLRRQLRPIQQHAGPRDQRVGDVGEEPVQGVAELVEKRLGIVE